MSKFPPDILCTLKLISAWNRSDTKCKYTFVNYNHKTTNG